MQRPLVMALACALLGTMPSFAQGNLSKGETEQIAGEAFIYGFPMVMNYAVFYEYFIDQAVPAFKAPINQLYSAGHDNRHAQQRHALLVRRQGPPG